MSRSPVWTSAVLIRLPGLGYKLLSATYNDKALSVDKIGTLT